MTIDELNFGCYSLGLFNNKLIVKVEVDLNE